jgi:hypothetical protein
MSNSDNPYQSPEQPGPSLRPGPRSGKARASLVLGLAAMISWCFPPVGFPIALAGLILGMAGLESENRRSAIAGVVLSVLGIVLSIVAAGTGLFLAILG